MATLGKGGGGGGKVVCATLGKGGGVGGGGGSPDKAGGGGRFRGGGGGGGGKLGGGGRAFPVLRLGGGGGNLFPWLPNCFSSMLLALLKFLVFPFGSYFGGGTYSSTPCFLAKNASKFFFLSSKSEW